MFTFTITAVMPAATAIAIFIIPMLFVLVDGWYLIVGSLVRGYS